jgi:superfamily II DNA or RNA helicase
MDLLGDRFALLVVDEAHHFGSALGSKRSRHARLRIESG